MLACAVPTSGLGRDGTLILQAENLVAGGGLPNSMDGERNVVDGLKEVERQFSHATDWKAVGAPTLIAWPQGPVTFFKVKRSQWKRRFQYTHSDIASIEEDDVAMGSRFGRKSKVCYGIYNTRTAISWASKASKFRSQRPATSTPGRSAKKAENIAVVQLVHDRRAVEPEKKEVSPKILQHQGVMLPLRHAFGSILALGLMAHLHLQPADGSTRSALYWSHGKAGRAARGGTCKLLVAANGYPCMDYHVKTKDGYILTMHRVPHGRVQPKDGETRQPVLLQHGVLVDGMLWFANGPDESLGFILSDSGFDVWVANTRGTKWSRRHASLHPTSPEFWDWSWDDLVDYELPALIDEVSSQTGQKVHYVGHSMGTLIALASFSQGKLVDKIRSAALLCPIAYLHSITTMIGRLAAISFLTENFPRDVLIGSIPTTNYAFFHALKHHCKNFIQLGHAKNVLINACMNRNAMLSFLENVCKAPGVDCTDLLDGYTAIRKEGVRKFDYESIEGNLEHYGQIEPPVYDMSSIPTSFPLFIGYGGNDALADPTDVARLLQDLHSHDKDMLAVKYVEDYAHGDFMMATNAKDQAVHVTVHRINGADHGASKNPKTAR
ncbi:hypothetical protein ACLOJK_001764 [Asimina triloba]